MTQSKNKKKPTEWNLENPTEGLAARALLRAEKTLLNIERTGTDRRRRERSSKMARTTRIRADRRRRRRNQNQKSTKRRRAGLGAMSRQPTANQRKGRSQSQSGRTESPPPLLYHRPAPKGPEKVPSQKWNCKVKKVRGCYSNCDVNGARLPD